MFPFLSALLRVGLFASGLWFIGVGPLPVLADTEMGGIWGIFWLGP